MLTIYNLNLTKDYCDHWTVNNAVRELIANTLDEEGTITTTNDYKIVFTNDRELPIEALLMGYTAKKSESAIGQYGEGLKIAMLVLTREKLLTTLYSGNLEYKFYFAYPEGFGVKTLHVEVIEREENVVGTEITIHNMEETVISENYITDPVGILPNRKGLYCQGMLVDDKFYIKNHTIMYGVNLDKPIKLNRDRSSYNALDDIVEVLEVLDPRFFAGWFESSEPESSFYSRMSPNYKQRVAKAWALINTNFPPIHIQEKLVVFGEISTTYASSTKVLVMPYWYYGRNYLNTYDDDILTKQLEYETDDEVDFVIDKDKMESRNKKRVNLLLSELELVRDIDDLLSTLVRYVTKNPNYRKKLNTQIKKVIKTRFINSVGESSNGTDI